MCEIHLQVHEAYSQENSIAELGRTLREIAYNIQASFSRIFGSHAQCMGRNAVAGMGFRVCHSSVHRSWAATP